MAMLFQTRGRVLAALALVALSTVPLLGFVPKTKKQVAIAQFHEADA
jgi:hypothetical protein